MVSYAGLRLCTCDVSTLHKCLNVLISEFMSLKKKLGFCLAIDRIFKTFN